MRSLLRASILSVTSMAIVVYMGMPATTVLAESKTIISGAVEIVPTPRPVRKRSGKRVDRETKLIYDEDVAIPPRFLPPDDQGPYVSTRQGLYSLKTGKTHSRKSLRVEERLKEEEEEQRRSISSE